MFDELDLDGDGVVDRSEWMLSARDAIRSSPVDVDSDIMYTMCEDMWDAGDVDADGVLTKDEVALVEFLLSQEVRARLVAMQDKGGNGWIAPWQRVGEDNAISYLKQYDISKNGLIDEGEFDQVWRDLLWQLGWDHAATGAPQQAFLRSFFGKADLARDGKLNFLELRYAAFLVSNFLMWQAFMLMLRELDLDGDGVIGREEVSEGIEILRRSGSANYGAANAVHVAFDYADTNQDGILDQDEAWTLLKGLFTTNSQQVF